ncbi:hypothetical protein Trco_000637 [Trichoderma cornu-damae]|uniref:Uncharacterized protein n=1 Tax=Trichoderma cornu-damae TaxID=654480 RepID=A0A9P8QXS4_9HYPO|nr:hypothetical protein Trco_000637 [Trichoderma cornu-damae]
MSSPSPRDPTRLRHALLPLSTTSLAGYGNQLVSPISAVSMASSHVQSIHTPGSAILPYNPQEWVASPATMPATERPLPLVGSEAQAPPPPPPYSPPRRNMQQPRPVSMAFEYVPAQVAATPPSRFSAMLLNRPSPEPPAAATRSFPPPPGASGRGSSRERLFALASLGRRRDHESSNSSEPLHPVPASRRSVGPSVYHALEHERALLVPASAVNSDAFPPASRRAASTGAIETPTSARSRSTSQTRWEPGMPLPPPPPGPPPPSSSRSQSVQSMDRNNVPIIYPPNRRPPPSGVSSLGPVPPTPADWLDSDTPPSARPQLLAPSGYRQQPIAHLQTGEPSQPQPPQPPQPVQPTKGRSPNLTIDTASASNPTEPVEPPLNSSGSASGLNRAKAVRHDKTILQRRAESRTRHESRGSIDSALQGQQVADIAVPTTANGLARQLTIGKATPRSSGKAPMDQPLAGESPGQHDSRNSTPRAPDSATLLHREAATPPFSPTPAKTYRHPGGSQAAVPKSLPTPPPQARSASGSVIAEASRLSSSAAASPSKEAVVSQSAAEFATGSMERFRSFAIKEASATTDADRVRLFSDFIVAESRIRRERYSSAIGAMGSEIFDLSRDLFRPMSSVRRESMNSQSLGDWTPESSEPNRSHRGSVGSVHQADDSSSPAPASASLPPSPGIKQPLNWGGTANYMPSLSPILSMSVSDNYENGSSRGRPPSRWWETDSHGDPNRGGFERSKRESKYMGVPKDQWVEDEQTTPHHAPVGEQSYTSEYPPEKTGWHDQGETAWTPQPSSTSVASTPSTATNRQGLLDVSRLVTMPPPYPRHHPAVNNNHPELTSVRVSVRSLSELAEVEGSKEEFASSSLRRREEASKAAAERRLALRSNLQKEINLGHLGYADAAAIESDFNEQEKDKKKEMEKMEYEQFQNQVVLPLNDILTERISRATELFDDLARHLFDSGEIDADMPQEEGDDKPELLEKLTLLKWIFEQRESLHRAIYDLLSDRNARYRDVVLTPYRLSGNTEKLKSAEGFFREDAEKREYAFANEVLNRARGFRSVMEEAVARGIELQLSAFWDIAPPLCGLLDTIPMDLEGFAVYIPASEYEENPAYHDHPLQYLYSLLLHAEKSTYQFIEAHTNQLCLLHQVKEAVVNAKARVLATQLTEVDGKPIRPEDRELRAKQMREAENRRLTEDLKEKVRVVQDQWSSSLGTAMTAVKERTGEWLLQTGGWDETLEDNGVGVV